MVEWISHLEKPYDKQKLNKSEKNDLNQSIFIDK